MIVEEEAAHLLKRRGRSRPTILKRAALKDLHQENNGRIAFMMVATDGRF